MQIIAIILYNASGEQRIIEFKLGALNIITGISATGKSALLDIVDFCLGRSTLTMAVGPISDQVAWYGIIVQLPIGQAFVARPAARQGAASTQLAMLELGGELSPVPFERLLANADIATVREQLGRRIGIEENEHHVPIGSPRSGLEANLGHAILLCLQGQGEIANRSFLFHRQGEPGIADAIKDTLPYFLGAVPRDQGALRTRITNARRELQKVEDELRRARMSDEDVEVRTRGFVMEAIALELLPSDVVGGRAELHVTLQEVTTSEATQPVTDDVLSVRRSELETRRSDLRRGLRGIGEEISLLENLRTDGSDYGVAVAQQISRLRSIDLLGTEDSGIDNCPICGSHLEDPDPTVAELRHQVEQLQTQLQSMDVALPARRAALQRLQGEAAELRQELLGVDAALNGLVEDLQASEIRNRLEEQRVFFKGRLHQYLSTLRDTDSNILQELEQRVAVRALALREIEDRLDPDEEREQIAWRLAVIGADMTAWATRLDLEHQASVQLDLRRLTVVNITPTGPVPLMRVGSAENWIGYHLVTHLALHKYFVNENLPVPHLLMLDQPTQAYYPSDVEQASGVPANDDDREAVRRLYELMRDVANELTPSMQIIACDHANLPEQWFQDAVIANWRNGEKLIPQSWLGE